jgi:hypothetical protein
MRAEVLSLRTRDFVAAARVVGASDARILARHVLPNVLPTVLVLATLQLPVEPLRKTSATRPVLSSCRWCPRGDLPTRGHVRRGGADRERPDCTTPQRLWRPRRPREAPPMHVRLAISRSPLSRRPWTFPAA